MRIYIGNLSYGASRDNVRDLFQAIGPVSECILLTDRDTGASRGTAFIEMGDTDAQVAISQLNGTEFMGRPLKVNEALPRENRGGPPRGDGGNRGRRLR